MAETESPGIRAARVGTCACRPRLAHRVYRHLRRLGEPSAAQHGQLDEDEQARCSPTRSSAIRSPTSSSTSCTRTSMSQAELQAALPPRLQPLAGPAAGALRNLADNASKQMLARPPRATGVGGRQPRGAQDVPESGRGRRPGRLHPGRPRRHAGRAHALLVCRSPIASGSAGASWPRPSRRTRGQIHVPQVGPARGGAGHRAAAQAPGHRTGGRALAGAVRDRARDRAPGWRRQIAPRLYGIGLVVAGVTSLVVFHQWPGTRSSTRSPRPAPRNRRSQNALWTIITPAAAPGDRRAPIGYGVLPVPRRVGRRAHAAGGGHPAGARALPATDPADRLRGPRDRPRDRDPGGGRPRPRDAEPGTGAGSPSWC